MKNFLRWTKSLQVLVLKYQILGHGPLEKSRLQNFKLSFFVLNIEKKALDFILNHLKSVLKA